MPFTSKQTTTWLWVNCRTAVLPLLCLLCCSPTLFSQSGTLPKDNFGRSLILHGLNTSSSSKHDAEHQPWIAPNDVVREDSLFGFNAVRYLIFWGALEPQKGIYDEHYLQQVQERVSWYTDRKMYVVLDMHQDIYGFGVGGNGAPEWASSSAVINNLISDKWAWWLQNLEPKVKRSYTTFWKYKKRKELQDHYLTAWQKVATLFRDNPYVIGYDLMNEPHGGNIVKTLSGFFEKRWLSAFYKRLIPAIRAVDREKYLFFEPRSLGVNFGMKSHLPKVEDAVLPPKLVYAPHCYPRFVDVGKSYNRKAKKELSRWFSRREQESALHQSPVLLGEFGVSPTKKDYDLFLDDLLARCDKAKMSWLYWSNDLGGWSPLNAARSPTPILPKLLRIYPKATAGELADYTYHPATRIFTMAFYPDSSIAAPTEIALPEAIYPNGYSIEITGDPHYKTATDKSHGTLLLFTKAHHSRLELTLSPKPAFAP